MRTMDSSCLAHAWTESERAHFDAEGYLVVEGALRGAEVAALNAVLDQLRDANRLASPERYAGIDQRVLHLGFITLDRAFMNLVDHHRLFPKVWGILGPNIYLYSTHLIITPPQTDEFDPARDTLNWHQDSSWMGKDMPELSVPARLSVKVAYFLTDHSQSGSANLWVLPGAHTRSSIDVPPQGEGQPAGAMPVCAPAGSAVIFDRRLWHDGSPNAAPWSRRALFYGYGYRWIRRRAIDAMPIAPDLLAEADPIRRQLLDYPSAGDEPLQYIGADSPLRDWLRQHGQLA